MKKLLLVTILASIPFLLNAESCPKDDPFTSVNEYKECMHSKKDFKNTIGITFKDIPSGSFRMGNCSDSSDGSSDEKPCHRVSIDSFYLAETEVTQLQYYKIMGKNPAYFKTDRVGYDSRNNPIENVSWHDAEEFIKKLNKKEGTVKYRLPTEAEWEYAARAGSTSKWSFGNSESELKNYAWYDKNAYDMGKGNAGYGTHPVAKKKPNSWGLYDMHGNVWEWVEDCCHDNYNGAPADGSAWNKGCKKSDNGYFKNRLRGGSWYNDARNTCSANRYSDSADNRNNNVGFRLARTK